MVNKDTDWSKIAANKLKGEMVSRGISYSELCEALNKIGINKSMVNVRKTIWMGKFPFAFYLQAKSAMDLIETRH